MIKTQEAKRVGYCIKQIKKDCLNINERLNKQIKELDYVYDVEKRELRHIRDSNIRTIQKITELELKEVI